MAPILRDTDSASGPDFDALVDTYYQGLYRFAFSLSGTEAEAGDLTQQTFYVWAKKGHQLRDTSKVKTWLFTTLHREFLKSRRRYSRFPHHSLDHVEAELPTTPPRSGTGVDSQIVLEVLTQLDESYKAPLTLFYLKDHSYKDIAEILEIPLGTVQSRISRGKAQLRQRLQDPSPGTRDAEEVIRG